jgi:hypothetical protein
MDDEQVMRDAAWQMEGNLRWAVAREAMVAVLRVGI